MWIFIKFRVRPKNISQGGWIDLEAAFASGMDRQPAVTCKTKKDSEGALVEIFLVVCPVGTCGR